MVLNEHILSDGISYNYDYVPGSSSNGVNAGLGGSGTGITSGMYPGMTLGGVTKNKYSVMNLPRAECPIAVFANGRMLTLGILGTDVECAYTGDQIIFEPGALNAQMFNNRITLIIEFPNEIYHYNVGDNASVTYERKTSSIIKTVLVSTIKKEGTISGVK